MTLKETTPTDVLALAAEVLSDRNATQQAKLLAATVLAQAPLPKRPR